MDLHSGQCVGYFDIPVDHVYGDSVILDYLASKRISTGDLVVVSPDVGGVARARAFAKKVQAYASVYTCCYYIYLLLAVEYAAIEFRPPSSCQAL